MSCRSLITCNFPAYPIYVKTILNKKVLLLERNRYTDRGVSSTTRGGIPPPHRGTPPWPGPTGVIQGGVHPVGVPSARSNQGYPKWGTPKLGYPPARSDRGGTRWGYPKSGYPWPGLTGRYPMWGTPRRGTPLARSDGGPPAGVRPCLTLQGYPPWTWPGYPLGVDRQTDTCQNITFPSYYVRGG